MCGSPLTIHSPNLFTHTQPIHMHITIYQPAQLIHTSALRRLLLVLFLCILAILVSAQGSSGNKVPPSRTSDPVQPVRAARQTLPMRPSDPGTAPRGLTSNTSNAQKLPMRPTDPGGAPKGQSGTPQEQQARASLLRTNAQRNNNPPATPSNQPASQHPANQSPGQSAPQQPSPFKTP